MRHRGSLALLSITGGLVAEDNKRLFDTLHGEREAVEREFGGSISWQRLDDRRASRISVTVPGGWADSATWTSAIEHAVDAMERLYAALSARVQAAGSSLASQGSAG